ncbi:hypothetical protein E2C01_023134 [Portunus trituberculatus]|uniref:Uncharacterized protein n=1 Tax=Portunus trituberculatus TaxID=210409 RepID=A0A5B7E782_PORTR|nr:hypothetical protein [Portunus trituberculatus]
MSQAVRRSNGVGICGGGSIFSTRGGRQTLLNISENRRRGYVSVVRSGMGVYGWRWWSVSGGTQAFHHKAEGVGRSGGHMFREVEVLFGGAGMWETRAAGRKAPGRRPTGAGDGKGGSRGSLNGWVRFFKSDLHNDQPS